MRTRLLAALLVATSACSRSKPGAPAIPSEVPDSLRGRLLATASKSGARRATPIFGSGRMMPPADAIISGKSGAAIVAVVVRPDGRGEKATRSVVYMDGHPDFAKTVCEFTATARFSPRPTDARGTIAMMAVSFDNGGIRPPGSGPTRPDTTTPLVRRMRNAQPNIEQRLKEMDESQTAAWFASFPHCSKIH